MIATECIRVLLCFMDLVCLSIKEGFSLALSLLFSSCLKRIWVCVFGHSHWVNIAWHVTYRPLSENILCKSACVGWEKSWWDGAKGMQILVLNDPMENNAIIRVWMFLINNHKIVNEKEITAGLALHCCHCLVIWFSCWMRQASPGKKKWIFKKYGNTEADSCTCPFKLLFIYSSWTFQPQAVI